MQEWGEEGKGCKKEPVLDGVVLELEYILGQEREWEVSCRLVEVVVLGYKWEQEEAMEPPCMQAYEVVCRDDDLDRQLRPHM